MIDHGGDARCWSCKECVKKYSKEWRKKNLKRERLKAIKRYYDNYNDFRERNRLFTKKLRREISEKIYTYLLKHPCVDCGETNPLALEFDHVRGKKKFSIAEYNHRGWDTIFKEIQKCDVRCSNCHKIKTHKDTRSWKYKLHIKYIKTI